ncbi:asparagine synthase (glutamine-hydrolyzing) [Martelella mangrovi]|uniref:asparagine synthase (glutamine-hydrolyzing) n=1 Tax=Martelella mangrovi TaxID=1397477 RepID=A0ABV2ICR6_9HYPH
MCGIVGIANLDKRPLSARQISDLKKATRLLAHRGPDAERIILDDNVGLGFRRLSIVDTSDQGMQPFLNEDDTILCAVNGEIYNSDALRRRLQGRHKLRSRSDCEVVVHLYEEMGPAYANPLDGMFAAAIVDFRHGKLLLTRDRFGIKPLFYSMQRHTLVFASEIKALFMFHNIERQLNWSECLEDRWLSGGFTFAAQPAPSYFERIEPVEPGTTVAFDFSTGQMEVRRYWQLPCPEEPIEEFSCQNKEEVVTLYGNRLQTSVTGCLMSDVEIGIALSGGIDSMAVAALAGMGDLHSFTILNQSTLANHDAEWAARAAASLRLKNHQVLLSDLEQVRPQDWLRLLWIAESPYCGAEHLFKFHLYRCARMLRPNLKVVLTGQGSDEFNGGYSSLWPVERPEWQCFIDTISAFADIDSELAPYVRWNTILGRPVVKPMDVNKTGGFERGSFHNYMRSKMRDLQVYNLWLEDRLSASQGMEVRLPFLNHNLVELMATLPPELHDPLLWNKYILRSAVSCALSEDFCHRPKGALFYGPETKATTNLVLFLIYRLVENGDLDAAFARGTEAAERLDYLQLRACIEDCRRSQDDTTAQLLLRLVNMALLDLIAKSPELCADAYSAPYPDVHSLTVSSWEDSYTDIEKHVLRNHRSISNMESGSRHD